MDDNAFKGYTAQLVNEESAEWAAMFNKKVNDIASLYKSSIISGHDIQRGYGNYNSKIVFVFKSNDDYKKIFDILMKVLKKYSTNVYDVYVCFDNDSDLLSNEISIIDPDITYFFFEKDKRLTPKGKIIEVPDIENHISDNHYIFDNFKHLITYNI